MALENNDCDNVSHGLEKFVGNVHRNPNWFGDMEELFMVSSKGKSDSSFVNFRTKL